MPRSRAHTRGRARSMPRGVLAVSAGRFGFVRTAEGEFFIPEAKMNGAFDGDLVEIAPLPARDEAARAARADASAPSRPAARVVRVVDRAHECVVGRYEVAEPFGVVVPEDTRIPYDIFTMRADRPDVPDGALVRVRIRTFPSRREAATGVVEEVLGRADDERAPIEAIIARAKLETSFSADALEEARAATLDVAGALSEGYRDLRGRFVLTVDPADARDFDDALSIERVGPGAQEAVAPGARVLDGRGRGAARWRLGVHIADVARYVPWDSALDMDARRRSTSVYLVDRVIPMLPEELSCGLCSLSPGEARRTMTADLYLDDDARLVAFELYPALIRSRARLSYGQAQQILDASAGEGAAAGADARAGTAAGESCAAAPGAAPGARASIAADGGAGALDAAAVSQVGPRLAALSRIACARTAAREAAGGLDFDVPEARVALDADGAPVSIELRRKTPATMLVEEAMILANETVAACLRASGVPTAFRVHEKPAPERLAELACVLEEFPWASRIDLAAFVLGDAHAVQQVLAAAARRPESELVSSLVLRAMKRAVYRPACEGHYGLASAAYLHFTSPIRRYPDLVAHRSLRALLAGRHVGAAEAAALPWVCEHASDMERVAEKTARATQELKIVEYMERFVGQRFSAVVSGVATYGIYVRLENTAEGVVDVRDLGSEYFALDAVRHELRGQDTGAVWRLGQRVAVVLVSADVRARRLRFRLA